jgi:hypothetical protein
LKGLIMELYRPTCLQAGYEPRSRQPKQYVSNDRAKQIVGHKIKLIQKFNLGDYKEDPTEEEYLAIYRYISTSDVWAEVTDELGDWNDVVTFVNSNNTATIAFVCSSYIRITLI